MPAGRNHTNAGRYRVGSAAADPIQILSRYAKEDGGSAKEAVGRIPPTEVGESITQIAVPVTIFESKGIPATRRERIEAAVEAGGKHVAGAHEAWIAADPFRGGFKVLITGPHGFDRAVHFAANDDPATISERVRETLDE